MPKAAAPITVDWGKTQIEIATVDRELPDASDVDDRNKLVRAGTNTPLAGLPEDAWHAVARAVVNPEPVTLQLRQSQSVDASLLLEEHVDAATLRSVHARLWLSEVFPAIQPRTGQEVMPVEDPQVLGVAEGGKPQAVLRYRYASLEHLRRHVRQTVMATLHKNSYAESILARRVTRALIVHPVLYEFEDGTEPVSALVARDGITRLASAWKVLAGPDQPPEEVADLAVGTLFPAHELSSGGPAKPLTQRMALARQSGRKRLRAEFTRERDAAGPEEHLPLRAVQIAQSYIVPAHITVGAQAHEQVSLVPEDVFDDALRSILASVHVEFKAWDSAAQHVEVASRALKRVLPKYGVNGLTAVYELAVGIREAAQTPQVYGDEAIPGTGLWRAVRLLHTLTRPALFAELRNRAKEIKGDRRMTDKGYAALLGPIVDHPWRSSKKSTAQQARNAWSNGGVLFKEILEDGWAPVATDDFTALVAPALAGDRDARLTLALAGGAALIADKLLTRNVGSSVGRVRAPGKVPFRADVHKIVEGLARPGNALGLWTLALAAQRFEDGRVPLNSGSNQQLGLPSSPDGAYQHVVVDLHAEDRILRDEDGTPVLLLEWDVVVASDEGRAGQHLAPSAPPSSGADGAPSGAGSGSGTDQGPSADAPEGTDPESEIPVHQRLQHERHALAAHLADALHALTELETLGRTMSFPPLLGAVEQWKELHETALLVSNAIYNHRDDYEGHAEAEEEDSED